MAKHVTDNKSAELQLLAEQLPTDAASLLEAGKEFAQAFDEAIMRADQDGAALARRGYDACVWKLNGGTNFGSYANASSPGNLMVEHCAATPGAIPRWGQRGAFLIQVDGMRAIVQYCAHKFQTSMHFEFLAVDLDAEFISETGYRSHFLNCQYGMTVEEVARSAIRSIAAEKRGAVSIALEYRNRLAREALPEWLKGLRPPARRIPETAPDGYEIVDVILPAHKAWQVKKWSDETLAKLVEDDRSGDAVATPVNLPSPEIVRAGRDTPPLFVHQRCKVVSSRFGTGVGRVVVVAKVNDRSVWAYDDKPVTYRTNRLGRRVVDSDPKCIQTLYGFDELEPA